MSERCGEFDAASLNLDSQDALRKKALHCSEIRLAATDIQVDVGKAIKLPFDKIPALGVGFASLPETFRSVVTSLDAPTLLQATDAAGNALDPFILNSFKEGIGRLGSYVDGSGNLKQAHFQQVEIGGSAVIPYDPTSLFMAAAIAQINQKLDSIQETVDAMFEFLQQKEQASLRGNVRTLESVLEEYRYNWNNEIWRKNAHMKIGDIRQESEKATIHLRAQIRSRLDEKAQIEARAAVGGRFEKVLKLLKEHQLSLYVYAFASFLEPMLSENFNEDYLTCIVARIESHEIEYRELYTECYNAIEQCADGAVDAALLGGVASAFKGLGSLFGKTPIGELTPVDEALRDAGEGVAAFNRDKSKGLMSKLLQAKAPDTLPFKESLDAVRLLYNHPHQLLADARNVYLLSCD